MTKNIEVRRLPSGNCDVVVNGTPRAVNATEEGAKRVIESFSRKYPITVEWKEVELGLLPDGLTVADQYKSVRNRFKLARAQFLGSS